MAVDKRRFDGLRDRFPALHRLLTSEEKPYPVVREVGVGALLVFLVLGTLWGYTGQSFGDTPVVVVESGSMMHCKQGAGIALTGAVCDSNNFGRLGTIDPGDLILVKDIDRAGDVQTRAEEGSHHYGRSGDVIIFRPDGRSGTPVIHRALFWVEVHGDGTFTVPEFGLVRVSSLDQPELLQLGLRSGYADDLRAMRAGPEDSGFITRGDNNADADQDHFSTVATLPVRPDWILGVARGEIPWLGLVKLAANDLLTGTRNFGNAASDSKMMLVVSLAVLLGGPIVYEKIRAVRREQRDAGP